MAGLASAVLRFARKRALPLLLGAAVVLLLFLQAAIYLKSGQQAGQVASARRTTAVRSRQVSALGKALTVQRAAAASKGAPLVPSASQIIANPGIVGPAGPPGAPGPDPNAAQVQRAVARYCARHARCQGPPARVTASQVATAIALYCTAGGRCQGPSGAPGTAGAEGPAPAASQVQQAVTAYCAAHGGCAGPAGAAGPVGPLPSQFTFTWTDSKGITYTRTCVPDATPGAPAGSYTCG